MTRISVLAVCSIVVVPAVRGQTCTGHAAYRRGEVQFGVGAEIGNGVTAVGGSLGLGKPHGVFGHAGAGIVTGNGETGLAVSGEVGVELQHPIAGKLELCPVLGVGGRFGPSDYYERNLQIGAVVGYPVTRPSGRVGVSIIGGLQGAYQRYGFHGTDVTSADLSAGGDVLHEWYGLFDAGIGVVLHDRFSVTSQVRIPVGYSMRDPSLLIRARINYGKQLRRG